MRFCISLPVSVEGVGPECCLSCHTSMSGEEDHAWSLFWELESLFSSRVSQSVSFKYCSMVVLAVFGSPGVEGILAVCFWGPGPAMHMMWGTEVTVWSGKRFTVLCPTVHRTAPYLSNAISPDHSNSHCSFEMSLQIWCGSWCRADLTRIPSQCLLRIRRCLVAVAKEMPYARGGSPCFHDLMSRRWSHAASLCQTLPVVLSQDLASDSRVISALDVQSISSPN
jgi:hypothetical protein